MAKADEEAAEALRVVTEAIRRASGAQFPLHGEPVLGEAENVEYSNRHFLFYDRVTEDTGKSR